jgi:hypothetical protein
LYTAEFVFEVCVFSFFMYLPNVQDRLLKPLGGYLGYNMEWRELAQVISRVISFYNILFAFSTCLFCFVVKFLPEDRKQSKLATQRQCLFTGRSFLCGWGVEISLSV